MLLGRHVSVWLWHIRLIVFYVIVIISCVTTFALCVLDRLAVPETSWIYRPFDATRVIRTAMAAFEADHVELDGTFLVTILAQNVNNIILVLWRHGGSIDLLIQVLPQLAHVHQGSLTDRTSVVSSL